MTSEDVSWEGVRWREGGKHRPTDNTWPQYMLTSWAVTWEGSPTHEVL